MGYGSDPLKEKIKEWNEEAQVIEWEQYILYVRMREADKKIQRLAAVLEEMERRNSRMEELQLLRDDWMGLYEEFMLFKEKFEGFKRETEETEETEAKYSRELDDIASQMEEFMSKYRDGLEKLWEPTYTKMEVDRLKAEIEMRKLNIPDDSSSSLSQNLGSPSPDPYSTLGGPSSAKSLSVVHAGSSGSLNVQSDQLVQEEDRVKIIGVEVDGATKVLKTVDSEN